MRVSDETVIGLGDAAREMRPPVDPTTVWRWCTKGVRSHGRRVKLESFPRGGRRFTSREAIERFHAAMARPDDEPAPVPDLNERAAAAGRRLAQLARL